MPCFADVPTPISHRAHNIAILGCILIALSTWSCTSAKRYTERANQAYAAGKYEEAALNYRNGLKKDPGSGELYYKLGLTMVKLGRGGEAYEDLNRAVSLSPGNTSAKLELATMCLAAYTRDPRHPTVLYKQASTLTTELLAKNPNLAEGLRLKGAIALIDSRPADAADAFRRALQIAPNSLEIPTDYAEALLKDNKPEEGERAAREAIAKHPEYAPPYELLYSYYASQRRDQDAVALLKLWISHSPDNSTPLLRLAGRYYMQRNQADAENLLNSLLQRRASIPQADLVVGDFHAAVRNFDKALSDYQRGRSLDRAHESIYREREASTLAAMGHRDEALKSLDAILAADAKNVFARALKTEILTRLGGAANLKTAAALATDLAKEVPGDARIQMIAGQTFLARGELDPATAAFRKAATADAQSLTPRLALAQIGLLRKNYPAVLENAGAALAIKPDDPTARLFRVIGLTASGSYAEARTEAEQLARNTKDAPPVEMQLGIIALRQKNYSEAERHFQKIYREGDRNPYPLEGLVTTYIGEHQQDRALQLAESELKHTPDSGQRAALLVATAEAAGKPDVALAELEKLAASNPKSADIQIRIGDLQRRQGNLTAALKTFQHASQLAPQAKGIDATIGNIQDETGQKKEAIVSYRKALAQYPDDPIILNNLAFLLTETGADLNEALRLATNASRKAPNSPAIQDTLAWIHIKRGNAAAMLPVLNQLTRKDPANATYRYHYAVALLQKGDRATARHELETALTDKPAKQTESDIRGLLAQIR